MSIATIKVRFILPDLPTLEYDSDYFVSYQTGEVISLQTGIDENQNPIYTVYRICARYHYTNIQDNVVTGIVIEYVLEAS